MCVDDYVDGDDWKVHGSRKIEIVVEAVDDPNLVRHEKSTFLFPR